MSPPDAAAPPARVLAAVAAVGVTGLVLVLAVWAASIGPDGVFTGSGPTETDSARPNPDDRPAPSPTEEPEGDPAADDPVPAPWWLGFVALLSQITTALVLGYVAIGLLLWLRRRWTGRERAPEPPPDVDFDVLEAALVEETADVVVEDAQAQRELLLTGSPRNAVVACWHRFETQAERVGMRRESWETPAEFVLRMLDRISADSEAVAELAELYREARFSEHVVDEEARGRSVDLLDRVHTGLASRRRAVRSRGEAPWP